LSNSSGVHFDGKPAPAPLRVGQLADLLDQARAEVREVAQAHLGTRIGRIGWFREGSGHPRILAHTTDIQGHVRRMPSVLTAYAAGPARSTAA
jgi:hypothetical protein